MANKTIPMDPKEATFYKGVAAGKKISEELDTPERRQHPFEQHLEHFWLRVGIELALSGETDQELLLIFVSGAMLRKPERKGFFLHIDTDGAAFHSQDSGSRDFDLYRDVEDRSRELGRILRRLVRDVESGVEQGSLRDAKGETVGEFRTVDS